jgi:group II intron reverse transcriptase/maturase
VLRARAKEKPGYRFYSLYDKVFRADVLRHAYDRCKANGGSAGVDGQTFEGIEAYGVDRWLGERALELRTRTYRPEAVRRVWIPKGDGGRRPLGIPTIRDRVVQMAAVRVVEPIFDGDLPSEQHAYRADHNAHQALRAVQTWLDRGYTDVVDADLSGYFDTIPHHELMKCVARRISDGTLLHLFKMWLEMPVAETDERGHEHRSTRNKDEGRGIPQGAVVSPLLANLYMRRFVLGWKVLGHEHRLDAHIVNYADDFVICCKPGVATHAMAVMRSMMGTLRLTVNERKTRVSALPEGSFTFLGFTFGRQVSGRTGRGYIGPAPSRKKVSSIGDRIGAVASRTTLRCSVAEVVQQLNELLLGWGNYFRLGNVAGAWRVVQGHACRRLRRWLWRKSGESGTARGYPNMQLYETYGLVNLSARVRCIPLWA